jgi:membrane fusion protein, multidrug efflux system
MSAQTELSSDQPEGNPARRRLLGRVAIAALVVGAAVGIYEYIGYLNHGQYLQSTDDAYVQADSVTVSSKLAGYVRAVNVGDNQPVKAGDALVEVDPTDYQIKLAQADAQIGVSQAADAANRAAITEAQAGISQATASLASAQRDLAYYNGEVARYRPLVASGSEPKQTLDQMASNRDKAAASVAADQAQIASAKGKLEGAQAQLGQSAAQINVSRAQADAAHTDLRQTHIVASVAGTVGSKSVRVGQYVTPGQRLMSIVPVQAIYIEANFKETQIGLMRPGQPVTITVDALSGVKFHGAVDSITPGTGATFSLVPPQNATGNFTKIVQRVPVRIRIEAGPEARRVLVPGLSLDVEVDTSSAKGAIHEIRNEEKRNGHE